MHCEHCNKEFYGKKSHIKRQYVGHVWRCPENENRIIPTFGRKNHKKVYAGKVGASVRWAKQRINSAKLSVSFCPECGYDVKSSYKDAKYCPQCGFKF